MLLCDSNVWLALALSRHAHHSAAREWFESIEQPGAVLWCRATQQAGRLRMVTTDAAFTQFRGLDLLVLGRPA